VCALLVVALLAVFVVATPPLGAQPVLPDPQAAEAEFVARINGLRAQKGLSQLTVDAELTAQARRWAGVMAAEGRIFHTGDQAAGITADWAKLGENVGVGGDVAGLHDAFVASPTHYANLVDPAFTRIGVGVVNANGRLFTTHRFMALQPPPPPPPPTTAPPPPPPAAPTTPPTTAAPPPPPTMPATTIPATPTTDAPSPTGTAPPAATSKLGPVHRIAELIGR
jgi:hypothetical protein